MREQGLFDPATLVFIDESVLQSTEGVHHELKPFVKLRERWGRAPRDQLSGAGLKPVRAAAVKSRGGERRIKSSGQDPEQVGVRKTSESKLCFGRGQFAIGNGVPSPTPNEFNALEGSR